MVNGHSMLLAHGPAVADRQVGKRKRLALQGLALTFGAVIVVLLGFVSPALADTIEVTSGVRQLTASEDQAHSYYLGPGTQLEIVSNVTTIAGVSGAGDLVINYNVDVTDTTNFLIGYTGTDTYTHTGYTILQSGSLTINGTLPYTAGLVQYGGTTVSDYNYATGSDLQWASYTFVGNNGLQGMYYGDLIVRDGTVDFIITSSLAHVGTGSETQLSDGYVNVTGQVDLTGSTINVYVAGDVEMNTDDGSSLLLLTSLTDVIKYDGTDSIENSVKIGSTIVSTSAESRLYVENGGLYFRLSTNDERLEAAPGTRAINTSALTGLMLTLQGADLVASRGMQAAVEAAKDAEDVVFTPFATMSGSSMHYNGTSESWLSSYNLLTGFVLGSQTDIGRFVAGAFFEYGTGSYKTDNSFGSVNHSGKGNAYYLGVGLLARMDFADLGNGHFHVEASGRTGGLHNSYGNGGLVDGDGVRAEYDSYVPYYSFHAGLGYNWDIDVDNSLEFYGKYLWTRECGDSVRLSTRETLDFENIDSSRLRFGARYTHRGSEYVRPYVGVAWEHEFDGVARSTTNNVSIPHSSLRGDTGLGEIGLAISPSKDIPLNVELGVTGYTGKRDGVAGTLLLTLTF